DNFRAALSWTLEAGEVQAALRLVNSLTYFWLRRGYWPEAIRWAAAAVDRAGDAETGPLCRALIGLVQFHTNLRQPAEARRYAARAFPMARRLEDPLALAVALNPMESGQEKFVVLHSLLQEGDDPRIRSVLGMFHYMYGDQLLARGRLAESAEAYRQSRDLYR